MKRKSQIVRRAVGALAAAVLVGCANSQEGERAVTRGCNPAFSPDGKRIAFQRYHDACKDRDLTMKLYENDRHEILNETDREQVFADLLDWMEARI